MYSIRFSKLYDNDVDTSYNYIKDNLQAPKAANNLIIEILEKLNKIKENPKIRPLVRDEYLANIGYRLINVKNFMIFYIIDDDNKLIKIIRFLYARRDWINILKETSLDEIM